mgnify:FL=1
MSKYFKILLATAVMVLTVQQMAAYDFVVENEDGVKIYYNAISDSEAEVTSGGAGYAGNVNIPASVTHNDITYSVTSIGDFVFFSAQTLTSVTIPESITYIGEGAFAFCSALRTVYFNAINCTSMGSRSMSAFQECNKITNVYFGDKVQTIPDLAFTMCGKLESITLPETVTYIGRYAFAFTSISSVTIPDAVTTIGGAAFSGSTYIRAFYGKFASEDNRSLIIGDKLINVAPGGLTSYSVPDNITTIGEYAFLNCEALSSLTLTESVTTIEEGAFSGCVRLGTVALPETITTIGKYAFCYCSYLKSMTIPEAVTTIGEGAFFSCTNLKAFYGKFASDDNRCLIKDNTLISIAPKGLTTFIIPSYTTTVGSLAFLNCTLLTEVVIPESVTSIEYCAFYFCTGLEKIQCDNPTPPTLGSEVFSGVKAASCVLVVPDGTIDAYRAADQWSNFVNISGLETIAADSDSNACYYDLRGIRMSTPLAPGLYIRRSGSKSDKVLIK